MPVHVKQVPPTHILLNPNQPVGYIFRPWSDEDQVQVVRTGGRRVAETYTTTLVEARILYRRLRNQGYERF